MESMPWSVGAKWLGVLGLGGTLAIAVVALGSCGSASKPAATGPELGDRRALPPVNVTPVDAGTGRNSAVATPAPPPPPAFPRASALGALAEGERIADLAVLPQADRFLLAWVTYFDGG